MSSRLGTLSNKKTNKRKSTCPIAKAKRDKKKILRKKAKDEQMAEEQQRHRAHNAANQKKEAAARSADMTSELGSIAIPDEFIIPNWPYPQNNNKNDIDLMIVNLDIINVPANECPEDMINSQLKDEYTHGFIEAEEERLRSRQYEMEPEEIQQERYRIYRKKKKATCYVPVIRYHCLASNGSACVVRAHGFSPFFFVRVPSNGATAILNSAFPTLCGDFSKSAPTLLTYVDQSDISPYEVNGDPTIAEQREKMLDHRYLQLCKDRDALLACNPIAMGTCKIFREKLEDCLMTHDKLKWVSGQFRYNMILNVECVVRQDGYGYNFDEQTLFYKITVSTTSVQYQIKEILKQQFQYHDLDIFNYDLGHDLLCLTESNLAGMAWITLPKEKYNILTGLVPAEKQEKIRQHRFQLQPPPLPLSITVTQQPTKPSNNDDDDNNTSNNMMDLELYDQDITESSIMEEDCTLVEEEEKEKEKQQSVLPKNNDDNDEDDINAIREQPLSTYTQNSNDMDVDNEFDKERKTWCRAEIDIRSSDIISHYREKDKDGKWDQVAPMRALSFDTEWASNSGKFPNPHVDELLCVTFELEDATKQRHKVVATYDSPPEKWKEVNGVLYNPNNILLKEGALLVRCRDEVDLLNFTSCLMRSCQPSELTAYNMKFDVDTLCIRAEVKGLVNFAFWSPMKQLVTIKSSLFQSAASGKQTRHEIQVPGVYVNDLYIWAKTNKKYPSYTLGYVSSEILGRSKAEMPYNLITPYFYGTGEQRKQLFDYGMRDATLVLDIRSKQKIPQESAALSLVNGVTPTMLLTRGQGVKTESQYTRYMNGRGFIMPRLHKPNKNQDDKKNDDEEQYKGATVKEPDRGLHINAITVLDFASLYPSIMMSHNLCYTTYIRDPALLKKLKESDYTGYKCERIDKDGELVEVIHYFVKPHIRRGLLPRLLSNLINEQPLDPKTLEAQLLEAYSSALKVSANSCYGFTAAFKMHLPAIAETVCRIGRNNLDLAINTVETHFTIANGYPGNTKVIYGDTDSLMIDFGTTSVKKASELGRAAMDMCNAKFQYPTRLDLEKICFPYLLLKKKGYAYLEFKPFTEATEYICDPNSGGGGDKKECAYVSKTDPNAYIPRRKTKGLESVRRDKIGFVKRVMNRVLDIILWERNPYLAVEYARKEVDKLMRGEVDMSELIKSFCYNGPYPTETKQTALARKLEMRNPGTKIINGDRMYSIDVVVLGKKSEVKGWEKVEDPLYALNNNLPIDYQGIAEHEVKNALASILSMCFPDEEAPAIVKYVLAPIENTRLNSVEMPKFSGPIQKFFNSKPQERCKNPKCRVLFTETTEKVPGGRVLCSSCRPTHLETLSKQFQEKVDRYKVAHQKIWDECRECWGVNGDPSSCTQIECPKLFKRHKLGDQLSTCSSMLHKLNDW